MAFQTNKQASKNQIVLSMVSKKSGKHASWVHLTEGFCRDTMQCEPKEVTIEMIMSKNIPAMYETPWLEMHVKDLTAELVAVNPEEY